MSNSSAIKKTPINKEVLPTKIELLKDIIFGDNIQQYDSEFETIRKDIEQKKEALEEMISQVRSELNTLIDNVNTDLNIRLSEVEKSLESRIENLEMEKVDKNDLGNLLITLGKKISKE
jgi:archaellum component FlaC